VPVVAGDDHDGVDVLAGDQLAGVGGEKGFSLRLGHRFRDAREDGGIQIAEPGDANVGHLQQSLKVPRSLVEADDADADRVVGAGIGCARGGDGAGGERGAGGE